MHQNMMIVTETYPDGRVVRWTKPTGYEVGTAGCTDEFDYVSSWHVVEGEAVTADDICAAQPLPGW